MNGKPATTEDFQRWHRNARTMSDLDLIHASLDSFQAYQAASTHDEVHAGRYMDECTTYQREIQKRANAEASRVATE